MGGEVGSLRQCLGQRWKYRAQPDSRAAAVRRSKAGSLPDSDKIQGWGNMRAPVKILHTTITTSGGRCPPHTARSASARPLLASPLRPPSSPRRYCTLVPVPSKVLLARAAPFAVHHVLLARAVPSKVTCRPVPSEAARDTCRNNVTSCRE